LNQPTSEIQAIIASTIFSVLQVLYGPYRTFNDDKFFFTLIVENKPYHKRFRNNLKTDATFR
jgi:hypothetical protein